METSTEGKRLWRLVRAVFYMLRKGVVSKDKLVMDLHLLLQRGKLAGKALGNFMTFHHHQHQQRGGGRGVAGFSCRYMDPDLSFYHPREVEFSCSNTPAYPSFRPVIKLKNHRRRRPRHEYDDEDGDGLFDYDAAAVAEAFEILNSEAALMDDDDAGSSSVVLASPSPAPRSRGYGRSPAAAPRRLIRVTDSPFPGREEEGGDDDGRVDEQAEEFIKRFYEQLRLQQKVPMTPDCRRYRREAVTGKA